MTISVPTLKQGYRIAFLDYLRIFAFLSVLIGHKFVPNLMALVNDPNTHISVKLVAEVLISLSYGGLPGVIVFFMVSGYIITYVIQVEQPIEFLIKRFFRIYPLYVVAILLETALGMYYGFITGIEFSVIVPRLLLIGDFTNTVHGLAGVEWTLRVELMFYILMFFLSYLKIIMPERHKLLPILLFIISIGLYKATPFPNNDLFAKGYLTLYGPFLFVGVMFYLYEIRKVSLGWLVFFMMLVLFQYFKLIAKIYPAWINTHAVILGMLVFIAAWGLRRHLAETRSVLILSNLTYAVYLFHNWLFDIFKNYFLIFQLKHATLFALVVLFIFCYLCNQFIEKPCVKIGRKVSKRFSQKNVKNSVSIQPTASHTQFQNV